MEVTEGAKRRPKRPLRTMKARVPSQKRTRVDSSTEVEEVVTGGSKRRKIGVGEGVEDNSGKMPLSAIREEARPLGRQGA